jgi:hypothetical protein
MKDYPFFISPRFIEGTTVEGKLFQFLNSLNTVEDFMSIPDKYGTGYSEEREGYGVRRDLAERLLAVRPIEGFTHLNQIAAFVGSRKGTWNYAIRGLGQDTFTDIVLAAIASSSGSDHRTVRGNFRVLNNDATGLDDATVPLDQPYDLIVFAKFQGSEHDQVIPVQIAQQDDEGNFTIQHITNDYEQFALVGIFRQEDGDPFKFDLFHRSGLIPIQTYPLNELNYEPILINQSETLSNEDFRRDVREKEGEETEDGEIIDRLISTFKDGLVEFEGEIRREDAFLWFDSTVSFKSEMFILPTFYANNWVRNLGSTVHTTSRITEQNHSNDGFWVVALLSFLVPGIGGLLGIGLGIAFIVIDANEDTNPETKEQINNELKESLGDEVLQRIADVIKDNVENATPIERIGLSLLSSFEETPEDETEAIIEFLIGHRTIRSVTINPTEMTFDVWLTMPFFLEPDN